MVSSFSFCFLSAFLSRNIVFTNFRRLGRRCLAYSSGVIGASRGMSSCQTKFSWDNWCMRFTFLSCKFWYESFRYPKIRPALPCNSPWDNLLLDKVSGRRAGPFLLINARSSFTSTVVHGCRVHGCWILISSLSRRALSFDARKRMDHATPRHATLVYARTLILATSDVH